MGDTNKDLEDLARSTTEDYYELLGVPFDAEESAIKRAYRKASIRYHPDKNPDNKDAADRFINLGWARDILIDAKLKAEYDCARTRRREKAFQDELLSGNRRKMKEELERRERESADFGASLKRKRAADMSEAERREQEIQRLAEDGKRRRKEAQDRKDKARKEEEAATASPVKSPEPQPPKPGQSAEIDRTIKIRFSRDGDSAAWDKDTIRRLFEKYGKIDSIIIAKDKKLKLQGEKHRKLVATAFIIYKRLDHAHAAVSDAKIDCPALDSVVWAAREPDLNFGAKGTSTSTSTSTSTTSNPPSTPSLRASLTSSLGATPLGTPKFSFSPKTPSLEEVTMMRLKNAERKRLEAQIRRSEAEAEGVRVRGG
ncbi:DnaJ-domain-containing protein [Lizonia empirigonia]|nr:DnaJ-domain-containing protein [Lizonia empirigonia]